MTANFALQRLPIRERFVGSLIKQAKSRQLLARTSLARPWQSQGKRKEAYDLLAPLYTWFTEAFDKKDLIKAKARLEELAA